MSPIIFAYEAVACDGGWVVMETDDCDPHPNTKVVSEVFATREEAEASALRMTATHEADATTAERRPCTQQRSALAHRSSPSSIDGSGGRVGCGQAVIRASERFWRFWRGRDSQPLHLGLELRRFAAQRRASPPAGRSASDGVKQRGRLAKAATVGK
jgi:hypothetical protein